MDRLMVNRAYVAVRSIGSITNNYRNEIGGGIDYIKNRGGTKVQSGTKVLVVGSRGKSILVGPVIVVLVGGQCGVVVNTTG